MMKSGQMIEISWGNMNKEWYINKGYTFTKIRNKFSVKAEDLMPKSNQKIVVICDYCNEETVKSFCDYTTSKQAVIKKDACKNCKVLKSNEVIKLTHGVNHPSEIKGVKDKIINNQKLSLDEIRDYFSDKGCTLISTEYLNAKQTIEYVCNKHHENIQTVRFDNFKYGKRYSCKYCKNEENKRKLIEKYSKQLSDTNVIAIDAVRKDNKNYALIKCIKHDNERLIDAGNIKNQLYSCRQCSAEVNGKNKRHSLEYVENLFKDKNLTIHNVEDYESNITDLMFTCNTHQDLSIQITNLANTKTAMPCKKCAYELISGENHYYWKGGVSPLHNYMRDKISEWKRDSLRAFNYECAITSSKKELVVHHIYNYSDILIETLNELNLDVRESISLYSDKELKDIENLLIHKHYDYGLGIPLTSKVHDLFHKLYGKTKNTYEQIEEFKNNYIKGEFRDVL